MVLGQCDEMLWMKAALDLMADATFVMMDPLGAVARMMLMVEHFEWMMVEQLNKIAKFIFDNIKNTIGISFIL